MKRFLFISLLALVPVPSFSKDFDFSKYSTKLRGFISDVVFEVEAGQREKYSKRVYDAIAVTYHGDAAQKKLAEEKLGLLLKATGVTTKEAVPEEILTRLDIYFGDQASLRATAAGISKEISLDRGCTFWTWWDDQRIITKAVVFISTDQLPAPKTEDKLLEMLLGAFGLPARSDATDQSCLSLSDPVFTTLQPIDEALLRFYYRDVPPGTKPTDLDKIVREKWKP